MPFKKQRENKEQAPLKINTKSWKFIACILDEKTAKK